MPFLLGALALVGLIALAMRGGQKTVTLNQLGGVELVPGDMGTLTQMPMAPTPTLTVPIGGSIAAMLSSKPGVVANQPPGSILPGSISYGIAPLGVGETDLTIVWTDPQNKPQQTHIHFVSPQGSSAFAH